MSKKLFIGGLKGNIKKKDLDQFLKTFGPIKMLKIAKDKKAKYICKGYCIVQMQNERDYKKLLEGREPIYFQNRKLHVKPYFEGEDLAKFHQDFNLRRVFVQGLNKVTSDSIFVNYFNKFGQIENGYILRSFKTKESKEEGFILYKSKKSAENLIKAYKERKLENYDHLGSEITVGYYNKYVMEREKNKKNKKKKKNKKEDESQKNLNKHKNNKNNKNKKNNKKTKKNFGSTFDEDYIELNKKETLNNSSIKLSDRSQNEIKSQFMLPKDHNDFNNFKGFDVRKQGLVKQNLDLNYPVWNLRQSTLRGYDQNWGLYYPVWNSKLNTPRDHNSFNRKDHHYHHPLPHQNFNKNLKNLKYFKNFENSSKNKRSQSFETSIFNNVEESSYYPSKNACLTPEKLFLNCTKENNKHYKGVYLLPLSGERLDRDSFFNDLKLHQSWHFDQPNELNLIRESSDEFVDEDLNTLLNAKPTQKAFHKKFSIEGFHRCCNLKWNFCSINRRIYDVERYEESLVGR